TDRSVTDRSVTDRSVTDRSVTDRSVTDRSEHILNRRALVSRRCPLSALMSEFVAFDPTRVAQLRLAMTRTIVELELINCNDPEATAAMRTLRSTASRLSDTWLPVVRSMDSCMLLFGVPAGNLRADDLTSAIPKLMTKRGWSVSRPYMLTQDPLAAVVAVSGAEARMLGELLNSGDLAQLLDTDTEVAWLAARLAAIGADPDLTQAFTGSFVRWVELAEALAWRWPQGQAAQPPADDDDDDTMHPATIEPALAALGAIYDTRRDPSAYPQIIGEMDWYTAAMFMRSLSLDSAVLAQASADILQRELDPLTFAGQPHLFGTPTTPGEPRHNTGDVVLANLLRDIDACAAFVLLAAQQPALLWNVASDQRWARQVVLAGTDPTVLEVATAGTVIRKFIEFVINPGWVRPVDPDVSISGNRQFLAALVVPWLFQFGPRAAQWGWTRREGEQELARVLDDDRSMAVLIDERAAMQRLVGEQSYVRADGHLDVALVDDIASTVVMVWQIVGHEEVSDAAQQRMIFDLCYGLVNKLIVSSIAAIPEPTTKATMEVAYKFGARAALDKLEEQGLIPPSEERAETDSRARFGSRVADAAVIAVIAVTAQLIDAGALAPNAFDLLDLDDLQSDGDDGCRADQVAERLLGFAEALPAGEARTTVWGVTHAFLNDAAAVATCR
ncbi:MAG: hypothetical protein ABIQ39_04310, partial [Ilumatobacteraceae bacterium]